MSILRRSAMTATNEIVTRALKKIGVVARDEAASADDMADGVDALNMMLHQWKLEGVDVSHTDLAATDTFSLASEYEEGTVYLLAERLSPDYMRPRTFDADKFFRAIQAAYMTIAVATIPTPLTRMPSQYWSNPQIRGTSN